MNDGESSDEGNERQELMELGARLGSGMPESARRAAARKAAKNEAAAKQSAQSNAAGGSSDPSTELVDVRFVFTAEPDGVRVRVTRRRAEVPRQVTAQEPAAGPELLRAERRDHSRVVIDVSVEPMEGSALVEVAGNVLLSCLLQPGSLPVPPVIDRLCAIGLLAVGLLTGHVAFISAAMQTLGVDLAIEAVMTTLRMTFPELRERAVESSRVTPGRGRNTRRQRPTSKPDRRNGLDSPRIF